MSCSERPGLPGWSPSHAAINSPPIICLIAGCISRAVFPLSLLPNCSLPCRWKLSGFVSLPLVVIQ